MELDLWGDEQNGKINLQSTSAGDQLLRAMRVIYANYKKQGYTGTVYDTDIVDRTTASEFAKLFNMGKVTVKLSNKIHKSLVVTYTYQPGDHRYRFSGAPWVSAHYNKDRNGMYSGKGPVFIRMTWGAFNFTYVIEEQEVTQEAYNTGLKFVLDIKKYVIGKGNWPGK